MRRQRERPTLRYYRLWRIAVVVLGVLAVWTFVVSLLRESAALFWLAVALSLWTGWKIAVLADMVEDDWERLEAEKRRRKQD